MIPFIWNPTCTVIATALAISIAGGAVQTWRLRSSQHDFVELQQSITTARVESELRAATTGLAAVETFINVQALDAPIVDRAVTRVRDVCLRQPADHLPVSAAAGEPGPSGGDAEDDRARAEYVADLADDLRTCAGELNRLDAIRDFHNANSGEVR